MPRLGTADSELPVGTDVIPSDQITVGRFVENLQPTEVVRDDAAFKREGLPDMLYTGHPGVITDATPQHILVDWVGLEDMYISFATGSSVDYIGGPVHGLAVIAEEEYQLRSERIRKGQAPLP